jgi:MFS family permease
METFGKMEAVGLKHSDISSVAKPNRVSSWRVNFATFIGTTLEWYDFFIYGAVAALVFNQVFFPRFDPLVGTLLAFATFSVGFVARPLGAIIFGHLGDTRGRKNVLTATLITMGITTILIGLLPSYETIGVLAPILLVSLRFIQGIGIGGEWGGAIILASEHGTDDRRGLHTSWTQIGSSAGNLLSFGVLAMITAALPADAFAGWGWRIPFVLSVTLLFAGIWVRSTLKETPAFIELQSAGKVTRSPLLELIRRV